MRLVQELTMHRHTLCAHLGFMDTFCIWGGFFIRIIHEKEQGGESAEGLKMYARRRHHWTWIVCLLLGSGIVPVKHAEAVVTLAPAATPVFVDILRTVGALYLLHAQKERAEQEKAFRIEKYNQCIKTIGENFCRNMSQKQEKDPNGLIALLVFDVCKNMTQKQCAELIWKKMCSFIKWMLVKYGMRTYVDALNTCLAQGKMDCGKLLMDKIQRDRNLKIVREPPRSSPKMSTSRARTAYKKNANPKKVEIPVENGGFHATRRVFIVIGMCGSIEMFVQWDFVQQRNENEVEERLRELCLALEETYKNKGLDVSFVKYQIILATILKSAGYAIPSQPRRVFVDLDWDNGNKNTWIKNKVATIMHEFRHLKHGEILRCTMGDLSDLEEKEKNERYAKYDDLSVIKEGGAVITEYLFCPRTIPSRYNFIAKRFNVQNVRAIPSIKKFRGETMDYLYAALLVKKLTDMYNAHRKKGYNPVKALDVKIIKKSLENHKVPLEKVLYKIFEEETTFGKFDIFAIEKEIADELNKTMYRTPNKALSLQEIREKMCNNPRLPRLAYCD